MNQNDMSFLGTGWSFPVSFDQTRCEVNCSTEADDIRESLIILLNTTPGERIMQPGFGCGLRSLLFDSISESEKNVIEDMISRSVLLYEPRVELLSVSIATDKTSKTGAIQIELNYLIRSVNTRSNIVFPFYLSEGTNVRM